MLDGAQRHTLKRRQVAGLTLIELLLGLAVAAVLMGVALPSFDQAMQLARLRGAADNLQATLRHGHMESVKRGRALSISLRVNAAGDWCFGASESGACDCFVPAACSVDGVERVTRGEEYRGIGMTPSVSNNRFSFQPKRMTVTSGSVLFTTPAGKQLRVVASGLGRVRVCSPTGPAQVSGYPAC